MLQTITCRHSRWTRWQHHQRRQTCLTRLQLYSCAVSPSVVLAWRSVTDDGRGVKTTLAHFFLFFRRAKFHCLSRQAWQSTGDKTVLFSLSAVCWGGVHLAETTYTRMVNTSQMIALKARVSFSRQSELRNEHSAKNRLLFFFVQEREMGDD